MSSAGHPEKRNNGIIPGKLENEQYLKSTEESGPSPIGCGRIFQKLSRNEPKSCSLSLGWFQDFLLILLIFGRPLRSWNIRNHIELVYPSENQGDYKMKLYPCHSNLSGINPIECQQCLGFKLFQGTCIQNHRFLPKSRPCKCSLENSGTDGWSFHNISKLIAFI